jgi:hypothetical protein
MPTKSSSNVPPTASSAADSTSGNSESTNATTLATSIHALRTQVPDFVVLTSPELRALVGKYSIDPKYIESAIKAVNELPKLQSACSFDVNAARTAIDRDAAYATAQQEAESLAQGIHGMRVSGYAAAIDACDLVLAVGKGLLRQSTVGLSKQELTALKNLGLALDEMRTERKKRRLTADKPKKKPTAKSAARAAQTAQNTAAKAAKKADKATARAVARGAKAPPATTNGAPAPAKT